eukprot:1499228-Rhodomonas_salina.1
MAVRHAIMVVRYATMAGMSTAEWSVRALWCYCVWGTELGYGASTELGYGARRRRSALWCAMPK